MAGTGHRLRSADTLIRPALAETVAALGPPESDAALVRLAEVTADAIDAMPVEVKGAMLGQTAPYDAATSAERGRAAPGGGGQCPQRAARRAAGPASRGGAAVP